MSNTVHTLEWQGKNRHNPFRSGISGKVSGESQQLRR